MRRIPWESGLVSVALLAFSLGGGYFIFSSDAADWIFSSIVTGVVWSAMALVAFLLTFLGGIGGIYLAAATVRDEQGYLWPRENILGRSVRSLLKRNRGYCRVSLGTGTCIVMWAMFACLVAASLFLIGTSIYAHPWIALMVVLSFVVFVIVTVLADTKKASEENVIATFSFIVVAAFIGGILYYTWPSWYDAITPAIQAAPYVIAQTAANVALWFVTSEGTPLLITFAVILVAAFAFWRFTKTRVYRTRICPRTPD